MHWGVAMRSVPVPAPMPWLAQMYSVNDAAIEIADGGELEMHATCMYF